MKNKKTQQPLVIAISGLKNSGKTTLIDLLLPKLNQYGLKTAVIKHDGHEFDADIPGTDSYRHFQSGAYATAVFSRTKYSIVKKQTKVTLAELMAHFSDADLILLEGFKSSPVKKIEIIRSGVSAVPVCHPDTVIAYATDIPEFVSAIDCIPVISINDVEAIVQLIVRHYRIGF